MAHLLGYARVSTTEQDPRLQLDALSAAGCYRTWTDSASGAREDRPELAGVLDALRPGDTLVVWRLDRLGRSLPHLLATVRELEERGVGFRSLTEAIDTTTPGGRLVFHVFAALAEFERELIRERTLAGLEAARARGRVGGRLRSMTPQQVALAKRMRGDGDSWAEIAGALGRSRTVVRRAVTGDELRPAAPAGLVAR